MTDLLSVAKKLKERHEYQSTKFDMPPDIARRVQIIQRVFDPADLAEDGLETEQHITVLYGLESGVTAEQVAAVAAGFSPFTIEFKGVSVFENPDFDVVVVLADSGKLRELNARLQDLPNNNTYRIYNPHLTIAYVKKGLGQKYLFDPLRGQSVKVSYLTFSNTDEEKVIIPLGAEGMKEAKPTKTVDGEKLPASSFLVVEDPTVPTTWHLPVMDARGRPDRNRMGAARAALTVGYRGQKYAGPQKQLALAKLNRMYAQLDKISTKPGMMHGPSIKNPRAYDALIRQGYDKSRAAAISNSMVKESHSYFSVFKQADGRYRWVTLSSNAFRDRDGEIVSTKALADDVKRADKDGDYGPLRFWHLKIPVTMPDGSIQYKGADIGDCDFNWLHGRTLIESGTFRNERVAEKIASVPGTYQISIGFRHPYEEPDMNNVFHHIRRFERSLVPAGRAANPFTSLTVTKENRMDDTQKLAAFKALLNDDEALLGQVLSSVSASEKTADNMGIAFKEGKDLNSLTADELLDLAISRKEAEMAAATKGTMQQEEDGDMSMKMGGLVQKMGEYTTKMGEYCNRMEKMLGSRQKEADSVAAVQEAANAHSQRLAQTEATIKELNDKLNEAQAALKELQSDTPPAVSNTRATASDTNVIPDKPQVGSQAQKEHGNATALDGFLSFVVGNNGGGA